MTTVTKQGKKRMKDLQGLNKKAMERQATLAKERGLYHKDMSSRLHKWVTSLAFTYRKKVKYIVYNLNLFVFNEDYTKVITITPVPKNLHPYVDRQTKRLKEQDKE